MTLIKCKECGKEISDKATTCIHCGCPVEKENKVKKVNYNNNILMITGGIILFLGIVIFILLLFVFELDIELCLYALLGITCLYLSILCFVFGKRKYHFNIMYILGVIFVGVFVFSCLVFIINKDYILETNDFQNKDNSIIIGEWLSTTNDYFEFFDDNNFEYTCYSNTCPADILKQTPIGSNHKICYTTGTYELKNEKSIYLYPQQSNCDIISDVTIWAFSNDYTYFCANNGGICLDGWQQASTTPYHLNKDGTRIK